MSKKKNMYKKLFSCGKIASMLSGFALFFSYVAANSTCMYIFHEPKKPDLNKLRRF